MFSAIQNASVSVLILRVSLTLLAWSSAYAAQTNGKPLETTGDVHIARYDMHVKMGNDTVEVKAAYHFWLPPNAKTIRAIIVHQHGSGVGATNDGPWFAQDLHWRELAAKWDCVLIGPQYANPPGGKMAWSRVEYGSDKVFLGALNDFARELKHPELTQVSWVLWGHSGGARWVSGMTRKYPERVLALCLKSGGGLIDHSDSQPAPLEGPYEQLPITPVTSSGPFHTPTRPGRRAQTTMVGIAPTLTLPQFLFPAELR